MKLLELEHNNCKGIFRQGKPYTLILGAGICFGIMPNWKELTFQVLKDTIDSSLTESQFNEVVGNLGWSLDSLLQAALNHVADIGDDIHRFNDMMKEKLYASIVEKASDHGLENVLKTFISDPFRRNADHVLPLYDFFKTEYENTTLFQVAEFLIQAKRSGFPPKAILTFNADVLLHALLTLMELKESHEENGVITTTDFSYKAIHHIIETEDERIPLYHIHGSIVPNSGKRDAQQNLVFSEASYHEVSGSTFSWQQSVFQFYAQRSKMVFIGLSMSDPNIRRWLSHTNTVLNKDVYNMSGEVVNTTSHLWVTTKSDSEIEREIKKLGLYHLGIKVAEIDGWNRIKPGLLNLIS